MLVFLDSGSLESAKLAATEFRISGITTNPKLAKQDDALQIATETQLPTSIQIDTSDHAASLLLARELRRKCPTVVIKVPISHLGLGKQLIDQAIPVNFTLCFSFAQLVIAESVMADYVSIFVGRMIDNGIDAGSVIAKSREYLDRAGSKTKIIAASIRNSDQFELAASSGAHISTVPYHVLRTLPSHHMTDAGLSDFAQHFKD